MPSSSELVEAVEDLVHDVAKYMVFEVRFGGDELAGDALAAAVRSDVCETRRGMTGDGECITESAWQLWERMLPHELHGHPLAMKIDALMNDLANVSWDDPSTDWREVGQIAQQASQGIRELLVSVQGAKGG